MNIYDAIANGNRILKKNNIKSAQLDSEILMSKVLNKNRKYIILNLNKEIQKDNLVKFNELVLERSLGKPVAYLTGKKEFWKHEFNVSEQTLVPRPDSEILVDQILKITKNKSKIKILEIGVGTGCILLSILKERNNFSGFGIDISKKCIETSKINATELKLLNRVKFLETNVDNFFYGKYDLIISNPPYIKKLDFKYLEKDVVNFEPKQALDGGLDGTSEIRKVINKSSELIKKNGKFVLEIAFDQKYTIKKLLIEKGFYINNIIKDYAKNDRCIISTKI